MSKRATVVASVDAKWVIATVAAAAGCLLGACTGGGEGTSAATGSAGSASRATPAPSAERLDAMLRAELSRDISQVGEAEVSHRDAAVRRAAARALARSRNPAAVDRLLRALGDEDEQVVAWAAYGLGDLCAPQRDAFVSALVVAATRVVGADAAPVADAGTSAGKLSAARAIARAVGRCAGSRSEAVLVGWARGGGALAIPSIEALGDVVAIRKRLREETYVALLNLAEGDATNEPAGEALYPLGRVEHLTPSVIERTRQVATTLLASKGPARVYAVAALGRCDEAAVPLLREVLDKKETFSAAERVEAARALARFGGDGQKALAAALDGMVPDTSPVAATTLVGPDIAVLLTVLDQLTVVRGAQTALDRIAKLPPPPEAPAAVTLRISWLRCRAAQLLAERNFDAPLLRGCDLSVAADKQSVDPLPGSVGARAIVGAIGIDAVKIEGKRHQAWRAYASNGELRSRQAALSQIVEHAEIGDAADMLIKALEADEPGLVATAAEVIAKTPQRVFEPKAKRKGDEPPKVVAPLAKALVARLEPAGPSADLEALGSVIDAVAALALPEAKEPLTKLCASPYGVVRERVAKALSSIEGKAAPACNAVTALPLPIELDRLIREPMTIKLETDVGLLQLTVDPTLAPAAATRAVDLAKNGFYDSMVVHRVVPGFVSQFGSPTADGYGGVQGLASLPCETSPLSFGPLTVGVALAGRDTGSSQLFVTHQAIPRLDGQYAIIGTASGPWDQLIDGDVIHKATVVEGAP